MALRYIRDPESDQPVEVVLPYDLWVHILGRANLPVPENPGGETTISPEILKLYGDPVEFQRRLRDGND